MTEPPKPLHRVFQSFIDGLTAGGDAESLRKVLADAGAALDLSCFAYLALPSQRGVVPDLISNYPIKWTDHYLQQRYERLDPVIVKAAETTEPFEWGQELLFGNLSKRQRALLDEARQFGIRCGFTVPIHDSRGPIAAVTFAADERRATFQRRIEQHRHVLQLMAMYFHAHARHRVTPNRVVDGVVLSPRELECLEWATQGKSAWEIGRLLNISRRTAAFHLDNAKAKFGVRTICQAVAKFAVVKSTSE
jgi:LuxR family transcriptional regulator, activator of conjugal transfer of Ti plasmids